MRRTDCKHCQCTQRFPSLLACKGLDEKMEEITRFVKKKKKNHTRHHAKKNKTKTYFACSKTNGQTNGTKTHTTILYVKTLSFSAFTSGEGDESIIRQSSFILTRTQTRNHKTKNKNNDKMLMVSVDDGGRVVKLLQRPANDSNWTDQRPSQLPKRIQSRVHSSSCPCCCLSHAQPNHSTHTTKHKKKFELRKDFDECQC